MRPTGRALDSEEAELRGGDVVELAVACLRHAASAPRRYRVRITSAPRRHHPTLRSTSLGLYGVVEVPCLRHGGTEG